MKRILVCSDIHGEIEKLETVLEESGYNSEKDQLILLGDYVDRGGNSKEVVELVIELVEEGAIALMGNHEQMFCNAVFMEDEWHDWLKNIGLYTYQSYDCDKELMMKHAIWMRKNLKMYYETENYIFAHASISPGVPMEWQMEENLLWGRHYEEIGLGKLVICGHTPQKEVIQYYDQLFIDTAASMYGKLSLVELPSMIIYEK